MIPHPSWPMIIAAILGVLFGLTLLVALIWLAGLTGASMSGWP